MRTKQHHTEAVLIQAWRRDYALVMGLVSIAMSDQDLMDEQLGHPPLSPSEAARGWTHYRTRFVRELVAARNSAEVYPVVEPWIYFNGGGEWIWRPWLSGGMRMPEKK